MLAGSAGITVQVCHTGALEQPADQRAGQLAKAIHDFRVREAKAGRKGSVCIPYVGKSDSTSEVSASNTDEREVRSREAGVLKESVRKVSTQEI